MNTLEVRYTWEDQVAAAHKNIPIYRQRGMLRVWKLEGESNEDLLKRFNKEMKGKSEYLFKEGCKVEKYKVS